jgi:xanthine/CO dehydrogenase XdhC/CoxF family maturation factor
VCGWAAYATAVSIAAEIVVMRWNGNGGRLAGTDGPVQHSARHRRADGRKD